MEGIDFMRMTQENEKINLMKEILTEGRTWF